MRRTLSGDRVAMIEIHEMVVVMALAGQTMAPSAPHKTVKAVAAVEALSDAGGLRNRLQRRWGMGDFVEMMCVK